MCNMAEASQNAYLVLIFYHNPCLKRADQSYIRPGLADVSGWVSWAIANLPNYRSTRQWSQLTNAITIVMQHPNPECKGDLKIPA